MRIVQQVCYHSMQKQLTDSRMSAFNCNIMLLEVAEVANTLLHENFDLQCTCPTALKQYARNCCQNALQLQNSMQGTAVRMLKYMCSRHCGGDLHVQVQCQKGQVLTNLGAMKANVL